MHHGDRAVFGQGALGVRHWREAINEAAGGGRGRGLARWGGWRLWAVLLLAGCNGQEGGAGRPQPAALEHSFQTPVALAVDAGGTSVYVAEQGTPQVEELDLATGTVSRAFALPDVPNGLAVCPADGRLYVALGAEEGRVVTVDPAAGTVGDGVAVGHTPMAPVVTADGATLYVANRFEGTVSAVDLASLSVRAALPVVREPVALALAEDAHALFVAGHLPAGPADSGATAAVVALVDTRSEEVAAEIPLLDGSTGVRGMCVSPDGRYAYVTHTLARYRMPTTQLDRGWLIANALSVIDVASRALVTAVLLDDVYRGAANPWGVAGSDDGRLLFVTHAGTGELSVIDRTGLHERLNAIPYAGGFSETVADVAYDLGFLSGLRERVALPGEGSRALAVAGPGVFVAEFFSDSVCLVAFDESGSPSIERFGPGADTGDADPARRGETVFNDARASYQQWLSCASCHPDGRSDGLNWDLGNDGLGSPRNAKSMLHAHDTPPAMITAVRPDAETAVRAGFKFIEFAVRPEEDAAAVDAYLRSLVPAASPHRIDGELGPAAERGAELFRRAGCDTCHSGPLFTDLQVYDVGTGAGDGELLDTPTLLEIWRTGPYLQDGRAATIEVVLTVHNAGDRHGVTSDLTESEIADLAAYVLSL